MRMADGLVELCLGVSPAIEFTIARLATRVLASPCFIFLAVTCPSVLCLLRTATAFFTSLMSTVADLLPDCRTFAALSTVTLSITAMQSARQQLVTRAAAAQELLAIGNDGCPCLRVEGTTRYALVLSTTMTLHAQDHRARLAISRMA